MTFLSRCHSFVPYKEYFHGPPFRVGDTEGSLILLPIISMIVSFSQLFDFDNILSLFLLNVGPRSTSFILTVMYRFETRWSDYLLVVVCHFDVNISTHDWSRPYNYWTIICTTRILLSYYFESKSFSIFEFSKVLSY